MNPAVNIKHVLIRKLSEISFMELRRSIIKTTGKNTAGFRDIRISESRSRKGEFDITIFIDRRKTKRRNKPASYR